MTLEDDSNLNYRETQIIQYLVQPMTSTELFASIGISYPHGIVILRKLKRLHYVDSVRKEQSKVYYFTIRTPVTEKFFELKATVGEVSKEIRFLWDNQLQTFYEVGRKLFQSRKNTQRRPLDFLDLCLQTLSKLRNSGYQRDSGLPTESPDNEELKRAFELRLIEVKKYIAFAEAMLQSPIWSETKGAWKNISQEPIKDSDRERAKTIGDYYIKNQLLLRVKGN